MEEFRYNDELLLDIQDQDTAREQYPDIYFALDHPELRDTFKEHDEIANTAKKRGRIWGIWAVSLATIALLIAAFEPTIQQSLPNGWYWNYIPKILAIFAEAIGIAAVLIGYFGVLYHKNKKRWLEKRLITERLRQWHAQSIIRQVPEILEAAKSEKKKQEYIKNRERQFSQFKREFVGQIPAELPRFSNSTGCENQSPEKSLVWASSGWGKLELPDIDPNDPVLQQIYDAYENTRWRGQLQYTSYKRDENNGHFWTHAAIQSRVLSNLAFYCILATVVLHFLVLTGVTTGIAWLNGITMHSLAMSTAIFALMVRALEEGLRPGEEVERLDSYYCKLTDAKDRFKRARSSKGKLEAIAEVEQASVNEMVQFLKAYSKARFAM